MPRYLLEAAYTHEALKAFASGPQDRTSAITKMVENLGGKVLSLDFAFGEYDIIFIVEAPNDITAAAIALIANKPGHLRASKTTKLISEEEMQQASQLASGQGFAGPPKS